MKAVVLGVLQCLVPMVVLHLGIEIVAAISGAEGTAYWLFCAVLLLLCVTWFIRTAQHVVYELLFPLPSKGKSSVKGHLSLGSSES